MHALRRNFNLRMISGWLNNLRQKQNATRVICIMGAARTGTHLLNSVICQSGQTNPLLSESLHLVELTKFQKQLETFSANYPDMYFSGPKDILDLTGTVLRKMVQQVCDKYKTDICVFRAPALSWHAEELYRAFKSIDLDCQFVCMLRDPRDAVVSMMNWNEKRIAKGDKPLCGPGEDILDFSIQRFWSQYKNVISLREKGNVHFIKYEDLTATPRKTARKVYKKLGLDFAGFDESATWQNVKADLSQTGRNGDCITSLYNQPVSTNSIGSYKDILNQEQERMVLSRLNQYCKIFYPEIRRQARKKSCQSKVSDPKNAA